MQKAEITQSSSTQNFGPLTGVCCALPGSKVTGTLFFGGAGIDGAYIKDLVKEMHSAGIRSAVFIDRDKWSGGTILDALVGVSFAREYNPRFPLLVRIKARPNEQFNLVGYSYGSLLAAQLAAKYALKGTVINHLVLIGSPISKRFLDSLRRMPNIKKVIILNLNEQGDPIYAGMNYGELALSAPQLAYQMTQQAGHFYYADSGEEGMKRRKALAKFLFQQGLR